MFSDGDINRIKNKDSKKNFEDVLQAYYSKNYKASILLLYNLVVNDLYDKLKLMNDNGYIDCKQELEKIDKTMETKDILKYSTVEEKIFNVYKDRRILNHSTIDMLKYFKEIRNKCAHPFFFKERDYTPIQEEVYLFIYC